MTLTRTNIRFAAAGMEVPAVTAEQMREVDRIAMTASRQNSCRKPVLNADAPREDNRTLLIGAEQ